MPPSRRARAASPTRQRPAVPDADLATLAGMGRATLPPEPQQRDAPARPAPAAQDTHTRMLLAALADAAVPVTGRETAAVAALATLDTATVGAVVQWILRGRPPAPAPPPTTEPTTPGQSGATPAVPAVPTTPVTGQK